MGRPKWLELLWLMWCFSPVIVVSAVATLALFAFGPQWGWPDWVTLLTALATYPISIALWIAGLVWWELRKVHSQRRSENAPK